MTKTTTLHLSAKLDGVRIANHSCTPTPVVDSPAMVECFREFTEKVEEALGARGALPSVLGLEAELDGAPIASTTCRPVPTPGTEAWASCFRTFTETLKLFLPEGGA